MNFDIIKKLIRLANNNPNENEANLAARKVCKQLAETTEQEMKQQFKNEITIHQQPNLMSCTIIVTELEANAHPRIASLLRQLQEELTKQGTWMGVDRSETPNWSSRPPATEGASYSKMSQEDFQEYLKNIFRDTPFRRRRRNPFDF